MVTELLNQVSLAASLSLATIISVPTAVSSAPTNASIPHQVGVTVGSAEQERQKISLNGDWETVTVEGESDSAPASGWRAVSIPSTVSVSPGKTPKFLWFRRDFEVPAGDSRRIFIDLRGGRYAPHIYVDGVAIGGQLDAWSPCRVEITQAVSRPGTHRLEVRLQDRTATLGTKTIPEGGIDATGSTIMPIGGYKDNTGIWDNVWLEITPINRLVEEEIVIIPSTRKKELTVRGKVDALKAGDYRVEATVFDNNKAVLRLPAVPVAKDGSWEIKSSFPGARYWSPEDPHLYHLQTVLVRDKETTPIDAIRTRFGFKEIWTQGSDFYLNGVKRHLLASSTWPSYDYLKPDEVRRRVANIRASNTIAFRLHTGTWQEDWLDTADEAGLLIIDESGFYTDGNGFYAYNDPRLWANWQDHLKRMIQRDRNHASLAMWSLGNEILFMGNKKYRDDLPVKMGELAKFVRTFDPYHPNTFEADLDPDNQADVIGLHYPHELPWYIDFPNTCDFLAKRSTTNADGGMLGKTSTDFLWERKKPLYIGEYLWLPQGDYSVSSVFFGDEAFLNRGAYQSDARLIAFHEQTIAYRRAGVSGLCPWTIFGFGAEAPSAKAYEISRNYYAPVGAFLRNHGLRYFSDEKSTWHFDMFNDGAQDRHVRLQIRRKGNPTPLAEKKVTLTPGTHEDVTLPFNAPAVSADTNLSYETVVLEGTTFLHREQHAVRIFPRQNAVKMAGKTVVVLDPNKKGAGTFTTLAAALAGKNPANTILLVAADALTIRATTMSDTSALPTVGMASGFDTAQFRSFLAQGGRALVLEQTTLALLGMGLSLVDHAATMMFSLRPGHPVLNGLTGADLKFWRGDNYVTKREIRRSQSGGARALLVTGGQDTLSQSPLVEMDYGSGKLLCIQALSGTKRTIDPAAGRLLQNALNYLAKSPSRPSTAPTIVWSEGANADLFNERLKSLNINAKSISSADALPHGGTLLLHGGGPAMRESVNRIVTFAKNGGTIYWHAPDPTIFDAMRAQLGVGELTLQPATSGVTLLQRDSPLLDGVSRGDIITTSVPTGWDRAMTMDNQGADRFFAPRSAFAQPARQRVEAEIVGTKEGTVESREETKGVLLTRRASIKFRVQVPIAGLYPVRLSATGLPNDDTAPQVMLTVNGIETTWFAVPGGKPTATPTMVSLPAGKSTIEVNFINGAEYGGPRHLFLDALELGSPIKFGAATPLTLPSALLTVPVGKGRLILDGTSWVTNRTDATRADRYANALLSNLGVRFELPVASEATTIPLLSFKLVGESPYFEQSGDQILFRSGGTVDVAFVCAKQGKYAVSIFGGSSPYKNIHGILKVQVDNGAAHEIELKSPTATQFVIPGFTLSPGKHVLHLSFTNDQSGDGEDRNLFLKSVGIAAE